MKQSETPGRTSIATTLLDDLGAQAAASPRRRQHHNIHASFADPCQRFFNALCRDTYIPPHRHSGSSDEETLIAVRGAFLVVLFDDYGTVERIESCGTGQASIGAVVPVGRWHTVLPLTDAIMLEIKAGPFDPSRAKEFAPWAPAEDAAAASAYRDELACSCADWLARH